MHIEMSSQLFVLEMYSRYTKYIYSLRITNDHISNELLLTNVDAKSTTHNFLTSFLNILSIKNNVVRTFYSIYV